jgi:hypothetical protein
MAHQNKQFVFSELFVLNWENIRKCLDDNGHNLLRRAIMGGNYAAFIHLLNKGFPLNRDLRNGINLLQLVVESAPTFKREMPTPPELNVYTERDRLALNLYAIYDTVYNYDNIAMAIVRNSTILDVNGQLLCRKDDGNLSLVHLIAAKGLMSLISEVKHKFGDDILECKNVNNITSSQMLFFFGHAVKATRYLQYPPVMYFENADALIALVMKYISDFKKFVYPKNSVARKCINVIRNWRIIERVHLCTDKMNTEMLRLSQQSAKWNGIKSGEDIIRQLRNTRFSRLKMVKI